MMKELNEMSYDQLIKYSLQVFKEVRRRAYEEGYEQGKFSAEMMGKTKGLADDVLKEIQQQSIGFKTLDRSKPFIERSRKVAQEQRDRIIEQAKADITGLIPSEDEFYGKYYCLKLEHGVKVCEAEFVINKDKRTVVAIMRGWVSNEIYARGIAKCAPDDCFNVHIGKAIALRRALGLEVPAEYLNAPQPTEVRVGDVIRNEYLNYRGEYYSRIVTDIGDEKVRYSSGGFDYADVLESCEIVDDSREVSE
ncbi:hypothetical protein [Siminovitchia sp. 179-K 8D1 HS]|uniref:hypothetical protein n=1 Tax=Siminovitchia sp. 179-K 8D1 HS TaxID=3142385 RepID=UPI0039A0481F